MRLKAGRWPRGSGYLPTLGGAIKPIHLHMYIISELTK